MAFPLTYTEYRPPIDLAPWIACFWQIAGEVAGGAPRLHRVLPDGCADILFDLESTRRSGGTPADLVGPMSDAQVFGLHGKVDLLGVRLRPGAVCAFSGIPADLLLDTTVPISGLPPSLRVNIVELTDIANSPARIRLLINAYRTRLAALKEPDPIVRQALTRWARAERSEFFPISVLTRDLGLSERAFERRFVTQVGLTALSPARSIPFSSSTLCWRSSRLGSSRSHYRLQRPITLRPRLPRVHGFDPYRVGREPGGLRRISSRRSRHDVLRSYP
jgi:hypothetical protein